MTIHTIAMNGQQVFAIANQSNYYFMNNDLGLVAVAFRDTEDESRFNLVANQETLNILPNTLQVAKRFINRTEAQDWGHVCKFWGENPEALDNFHLDVQFKSIFDK